MGKVLLITPEDLVTKTVIEGNVDEDKFMEIIAITQDFNLKPLIGEDLLKRLQDFVVTPPFVEPYLTLWETFVRDYLCQATAAEFIKLANYSVANGGVTRYEPTNGSSVGTTEIEKIVQLVDNRAQGYANLMIKHLNDNRGDFPEYTGNTVPVYFESWFIKRRHRHHGHGHHNGHGHGHGHGHNGTC